MLRHFTKLPLFLFFSTPSPQFTVVNVGWLWKQSWMNGKPHEKHWKGGGGLNIFYLPVRQDMCKKMCDIHLSQLVLTKIVAIKKVVIHFLPLIRGKVVMLHSDNCSAVADLQSLIAHVPLNIGHPVLPAAWDHSVSETHPWLPECSNRQPFEKALDHRDRMVPAPRHSVPDVLHFVHSGIGSVCNLTQ